MQTHGVSSGSRALRCTVAPAATAARTCWRVSHSFYCRSFTARAAPRLFPAFTTSAGAPPALSTPCRLLSSGTSQTPPGSQTEDHTEHGVSGEAREAAGTPAWVSSHKQNGEKRMSVSIRSGAQRQRARRPPNVPPHAPPPPPPPSSIHPSSTVGHVDCSSAAPPQQPTPLSTTAHRDTFPEPDADTHPHHLKDAATPQTPEGSYSFVAGDTNTPLSTTTSADAASRATSSATTAGAPPAPASGDTAASKRGTSAAASSVYSAAASSSNPLLYSVSRFTEPVKRIILIRNGRSEANEDVAAYVDTPDWRIPLVEEGKRESIAAGRALSELTGDDPVYFYYSPYIRSRQSLRYVLQGYDEARLSGHVHTREWWEEEEGNGGILGGADGLAGVRTTFSGVSSGADAMGGEGGDVSFAPYADGGLPLETAGIATTSAETAGCRGGEVAEVISTDPTTDIASAAFLQKEASLVLDSGTSDNIIGVREDVRLRDGDIGRYTTVEELMHHLLERERYGKFFYRFPYGESGADVCDRVTSFLDAFQRERVEFPMNTNVVIITHGLTMRMFIKRWFHLTVETFHRMKSPPPGSLCTLTRLHHRSCFRLDESCVESMHLPLSLNEYNGYKYRNKQLLGSMSSGAPYM